MITPASDLEDVQAIRTDTFLDRDEKGRFFKGMKGAHTSHGMEGTNFYSLYYNMRGRCTNEKSQFYHYYGGRGIKCLWPTFEDFRNDMYDSYLAHQQEHGKLHTTLDRIDNDGDYSKENCRWATRYEQASNTRKNVYIEYEGERLTIFQWARKIGIAPKTMWYRMKNMPIEKALTRPLNKKHANNKS